VESTPEVEYIASSEVAKEDVWIIKFMIELGVLGPMEIYCGSNDAIAQAKEPMFH
jgi:hypothetical protein